MFKKNIIIAGFVLLSLVSSFAQNIEEGKNFLRNENFSKAVQTFQSLNTPEALFYLGETYFKMEKFDLAKDAYQKGITADNNFGLNYAGLAKVNFRENNAAEAEKNIAEALRIADEKDIPIYQAVADAYINGGKDLAGKAKDILETAIKMTPKKQKKDKRTFILLGDMYMVQNNGSAAVENYKKAVDIDSSAVALVGIGKIFTFIKNYGEAELSFSNAMQVDPNYSVTYKELAELKYALKQYPEAIDNFKKYIERSENSFENRKRLVNFYYMSKDYKTSVDLINDLLKEDPKNVNLLHLRAYSYSLVGDSLNGIPAFQEFFRVATDKDLVISDYEYYAKLLTASGNDSLAVEQLQKAVLMDTSRCDLFNSISVTYFKMKKWDRVINTLNTKESKCGLAPQEYFDLGKALYFIKEYTLADTAFAQLIAAKPELSIGYLWRARSNAMLDSTSEKGLAKPYYDQLIPIIQSDTVKYKKDLIESYSYLGYYYYLQNDIPTMKSYWEKVLALDPGNKQAIEALNYKGNRRTRNN